MLDSSVGPSSSSAKYKSASSCLCFGEDSVSLSAEGDSCSNSTCVGQLREKRLAVDDRESNDESRSRWRYSVPERAEGSLRDSMKSCLLDSRLARRE